MPPPRKLLLPLAVCVALALILPVTGQPAAGASVASGSARMNLQRIDGGPQWYGQFSNPLPTAASFFPIGVWFESVTSPADIAKDKRAGLNTYVVLTGNSNLRLIESNGMSVIAQHGEWTHKAGARGAHAIAGWELADEIDMQLGPQEGFQGLQRILASLPADGRLRYNNYGKGVMFWETDAQAARFVNAQDLVSADTYWFTDNNICSQWEGGALMNGSTRSLTPAQCHRASNYGATVRRMRSERNQAIWKRMSSLYYAKRVDEALASWHEDARWEAVYPVKGLPAVVEGRAALTETFAGMVALAERIQVHDVRFHQTDDPDVAFIEERMVLELVDGGRYDNRIAMRVTFRDGLIAEMLEYSGPHETEELLRRLAVAAEA